jgi:hypothetical protein
MAGSDVKAKFIEADTTAADADGVCTSQTPAAGGEQDLTIDGALSSGGVATFTAARFITIASAADDSARTFTVTGTDVNGAVQTETIAGPATTVTGTSYFRTVTQVTVDDDTAGAITVGMANNALDVVFAGRARLRSVFLVHSGTAGTLSFRNGSATAEAYLTVPTIASANSDRDFFIPDEGILFENGIFLPYTAGTTVFSSFTAMFS